VPVRSRPSISRRQFLRGVLGVTGVASVSLATGCGLLGDGSQTPPPPDPLVGFLQDTTALADLYEAGLAAVTTLGPVITGPRNAHRAHARALAQAIGVAAPRPSGTATAAAPGSDRASVLAGLIAAENKARDAAVEACLSAAARLAPLVGSIAAARATHLEVLR
jgi:hypothetical protein